MINVSINMPAIRYYLWDRMYDSLIKSCQKYSFELVMCGPYELTPYLKNKNNVKMIIDYGSPSRAAQLASFECEGLLMYHVVDDALFVVDAIDKAIDLYQQQCGRKDAVAMRYTEGINYRGEELNDDYWYAWTHKDLRLAGIPKEYKICCHHMLDIEYFRELGGWDCQYEYINHSLHDLMFRLQADGGKLINSPITVTNCDHLPGHAGDHAPVHDAQVLHDKQLFENIYSKPNALHNRINIDINNWIQQPAIWTRRFKDGIPK